MCPKNKLDKFLLYTTREYGNTNLMRPRMKNTFAVKITPIHTKYCEAQRAFTEVTIDTYKQRSVAQSLEQTYARTSSALCSTLCIYIHQKLIYIRISVRSFQQNE